jgi:hypothetical protein
MLDAGGVSTFTALFNRSPPWFGEKAGSTDAVQPGAAGQHPHQMQSCDGQHLDTGSIVISSVGVLIKVNGSH